MKFYPGKIFANPGLKFLLKLSFASMVILALSCSSAVVRWPKGLTDETEDRSYPFTLGKDIFTDFLWTAPLVGSRLLTFQNGAADVKFANENLVFRIEGGRLSLTVKGAVLYADAVTTPSDHYYSIEKLGTKIVPRSRMVPKTRTELQSVSVQKSRNVTRMQSTYNPSTKSYTMQPHSVTEYYTAFENRMVAKTVYEWETVMERVHDIPVYAVFPFNLHGGEKLLVYRTESGLYLQNASYYSIIQKKKGFIGEFDVRVMFIDANADGHYTGDQDRVLFNVWNPYAKNSVYNELPGMMDNVWFDISTLRDDMFLTFSMDRTGKSVEMKNANSSYRNNSGKGKITVSGIRSGDMTLIINGRVYKIPAEGTFRNDIEYGIYKLRIKRKGYSDFTSGFVINDAAPAKDLVYKETARAGTFILVHAFRQWKISGIDQNNKSVTVYNENEISLLPGNYSIIVAGDGTTFEKKLTVGQGDIWVYDFMADKIEKK